jgi:cell division protein FtsA
MAAGIVLTGGTAKIEGAVELAEEIFHMPVRVGAPTNVKGLGDIVKNPIYATGVGLLQYAVKQLKEGKPSVEEEGNHSNMIEKIKQWFKNNF